MQNLSSPRRLANVAAAMMPAGISVESSPSPLPLQREQVGRCPHVDCHGDARAAPLPMPAAPRPAEAEAGRWGGSSG